MCATPQRLRRTETGLNNPETRKVPEVIAKADFAAAARSVCSARAVATKVIRSKMCNRGIRATVISPTFYVTEMVLGRCDTEAETR